MNLKVIHSKGQFTIYIVSSPAGYDAMLFTTPAAAPQRLFSGESMQDPYYHCLSWASANIHGEFVIEPAHP
jgi:hypothetical protein